MNQHKRRKTKAITCYVDPKFTDTIEYIRTHGGITQWIETQLSNYKDNQDD